MLPKFFAAWLIVLVIVPFTAPFSVYDFVEAQGEHASMEPLTSADPGLPVEEPKISSAWARYPWTPASAEWIREQVSLATILRL